MTTAFQLQLTPSGLEEDELTVRRSPYIAIQSSLPKGTIEDRLKHAKIPHHWFSTHFGIELADHNRTKALFQPLTDDAATHLRHYVSRVFEENPVSMDVLEAALGPTLWTVLRPFQRVGVQFTVSRQRAYLADEMGSGKTVQAAGFLKYFQPLWPALIVCPSSLRFSLQAELMRWLELSPDDVVVITSGADFTKKKLQERLLKHKILILSYGLIGSEWIQCQNYQIVVCDEAHYLKSRESARFKAMQPIAHKAQTMLLLSGTPFSYPVELYSQLSLLQPLLYPRFFHFNPAMLTPGGESEFYFATRYCKPKQIGPREQWLFRGYDHRDELQTILWTVMLRRRKKDILPQLPPKIRTCITLEPLADRHQKEIRALLDQEEAKGQGDYMNSFRLTCEYKIPKVLHFLSDCVIGDLMAEDPSLKVLVFFHHSQMKEALQNFFTEKKISFFTIDGAVEPQKRFALQQEFQEKSKYRVGLLSIMAAGAGLTLTAARLVIFAEILFGPEILQAEDRAHRVGQVGTVNILYTVQPNTTDMINWQLIKKKERESSIIMDGEACHLQNSFEKLGDQSLSQVLKRKRETTEALPVPKKCVFVVRQKTTDPK
jgi:SWI/SNF-related matrix-associated actin-dependent regulator of chromatin subfamily A-like protein 1